MHNELTSRPHSYSPGYQEGKEFEEKNTEEKKQVEVLYYSVGMESWEEMNKKNKSGEKKERESIWGETWGSWEDKDGMPWNCPPSTESVPQASESLSRLDLPQRDLKFNSSQGNEVYHLRRHEDIPEEAETHCSLLL